MVVMIPFICGYMKALLFTDLHGSEKTLKKIFDFISNPANQIKMMLFAGDFVNMGEPLEYQKKFIQLHTLNSVPLFWVPGNNDFGRSYKLMMKYLPSVEGRVEEYQNHKITGVGGSPASWSGEYQGETGIKAEDLKDSIFLSHQPPPGLSNLIKFDKQDTITKKPHFALRATRGKQDTIKSQIKNDQIPNQNVILSGAKNFNTTTMKQFSYAPRIHICGHIHNQWGIGYIGGTKVVKLAASYLGFAAIMDLETLMVAFIEL